MPRRPSRATWHGRPNVALRMEIPAPADEAAGGGALVLLGSDPANELERIAGERIVPPAGARAGAGGCRAPGTRGDPARATRCRRTARPGSSCWPARARTDPSRIEAPRGGPGRPCDSCCRHRAVTLRGTAESLELRLVAATPTDDPDGLATAAPWPAFLGRPVAVSRPFVEAGAATRRRGRRAGDARGGEALDPTPPVAPGRAACPPICCWATCTTCRTACAMPGICSPRSSSVASAVQRDRLATLRAVLGDGQLGGPRTGSVSTGTRSPIGSRASRRSVAGTCRDPELGSRWSSPSDLCKMHKIGVDAGY